MKRDGLLPRMEARPHRDGRTITYRYHPVGGKPINLGTDRADAIRQVLDLNGQTPHHGSLLWVWENWKTTSKRWARLAEGTQADYELAWKQINERLGRYPAAAITAPMVARYVHLERGDSPRRANIEKALLSNLFKHAIMVGVAEHNPTVGVEPHVIEAKRVMPATPALQRFLTWLDGRPKQQRIAGLMAEFIARGGSRRVEFIGAAWMQYDPDAGVIRLQRAKQRGRVIFDVLNVSPEMRSVLERARALNPDSPYLFPTRDGSPYSTSGFKTLWQRCMATALAQRVLAPEERFNFHALRRYYTTMHRQVHGKRPQLHEDERVTAAVYDATREVVRRTL